jgi:putative DNA primase/helicase
MLDGCALWQSQGLNPPQAVRTATKEYLDEADTILEWLTECCERDPRAAETAKELFACYSDWCKKSGEWPGSKKEFSQALADHGLARDRTNSSRRFHGIRITDTSYQQKGNNPWGG